MYCIFSTIINKFSSIDQLGYVQIYILFHISIMLMGISHDPSYNLLDFTTIGCNMYAHCLWF